MTVLARRLMMMALLSSFVITSVEAEILPIQVDGQSEISTSALIGDRLHISLPLQAGTGFSWRIANVSGHMLIKRRDGSAEKGETSLLGKASSQVYEFDCENAGEQNLVFELVGPPGSPDGDRAVRFVKIKISIE